MECFICHTKFDSKRLPMGWKRLNENMYCDKCWKQRYVLRAITIPVASPEGKEWAEFKTAMAASWGRMTELSNWMLSELYVRDVRRTAGMTKLPKMPQVYLYPEARIHFPELPSQTVAATEQAVKGKYKSIRYKLLWTHEISLANYKYPAPFVIPNQGWSALYGKDGIPLVQFRMADERWTVRLRGGYNYRRPLVSFAQVVSKNAVQGELAFFRQRANGNDNRSGITERDNGGQKSQYRIMCKIVAWLPKEDQTKPKDGVLLITPSNNDALLTAYNGKKGGEELEDMRWQIHADHVRRWVAENRRRNDNRSNDRKLEVRQSNKSLLSFGEKHSLKYRRRMKTACDQIAAQVVNYAKRWNYAMIRVQGQPGTYIQDFTWFALWQAISYRCDAENILFEQEIPDGKTNQVESK